MFSVCTVLYGDYPQLAERLLDSLKLRAHVQDFRIGLNAVSGRTRELVETWAKAQAFTSTPPKHLGPRTTACKTTWPRSFPP